MQGRYLTITVKEDLYKYLTQSLQSTIIKPQRDSTLMNIIKPHLCLEPEEWELQPIRDDYRAIQIELPDLRQVYSARDGKMYYCDTLFRDHITKKGLEKVRRFLKQTFHAQFYSYLTAWVERQHVKNESAEKEKRIEVTNGIVAFFNSYHIEFDEKMIEAYRQSWIRYLKNLEKYKVSPVLY
jgi:tagatose-1,6-bisphosphate aldolase non-catalytic subunit AgaZ/GatZ